MELLFWLLGGLGLFLYGIDMMGKALRRAAGLALRKVFGHVTKNRFRGLLTGTVVTGLIQSSSAATAIIVGFISAGLLTFQQSVSLILGDNIFYGHEFQAMLRAAASRPVGGTVFACKGRSRSINRPIQPRPRPHWS